MTFVIDMPRVYTQTYCAVIALIERDGKFLLIKEKEGKGVDAGKWNTPGGWLDVSENPVDAVIREAKEESGYEFTPRFLLGIFSIFRKDIVNPPPHPIHLVFIGDISEEQVATPLEDEVAEIKWFSPEEIFNMDKTTLRFLSIKEEIRDFIAGKRYPLEMVHHIVQE